MQNGYFRLVNDSEGFGIAFYHPSGYGEEIQMGEVTDYLEDMKALNLKGRTFALMENGTWAPNAGKLMGEFVAGELGGTVLEPKVTMRSTLAGSQAGELEALADAIAASVKG